MGEYVIESVSLGENWIVFVGPWLALARGLLLKSKSGLSMVFLVCHVIALSISYHSAICH